MAGVINIFGLIGEGDIWFGLNGNAPKDVQDQIDLFKDETELTVRISSYGGDCDAGETIYNLLKNSGKKITIEIVGQCYSIATVIAMAGDSIKIAENGRMMIHQAWVPYTQGNADQLRETADELERRSQDIFNYYLDRPKCKENEDKLREYFDEEKEIDAETAIELGLCDSLITKVVDMPRFPLKAVAYFKHKTLNAMDLKKLFADFKNEIMSEIKKKPVLNASVTTDSNSTIYYDGELKEGTKVFTDEAMTEPASSFKAGGKSYTVKDGAVESITDVAEDSAVEGLKNQITEKETEIANLKNQISELNTKTAEQAAVIEAVNAKVNEFENLILGDDPTKGGNKPVNFDDMPKWKQHLELKNKRR